MTEYFEIAPDIRIPLDKLPKDRKWHEISAVGSPGDLWYYCDGQYIGSDMNRITVAAFDKDLEEFTWMHFPDALTHGQVSKLFNKEYSLNYYETNNQDQSN